MTNSRSEMPTFHEIKDMTLVELFREMARAQLGVQRIEVNLKAGTGSPKNLRKALTRHEKALVQMSAEMAERYLSESEARRAVLFRMMANVAIHAKVFLAELGESADPASEAEKLLTQSIDDLESLRA